MRRQKRVHRGERGGRREKPREIESPFFQLSCLLSASSAPSAVNPLLISERVCSAAVERVFSSSALHHPPHTRRLAVSRLNRRSFLKHTLATAATVTIAGTKSSG